MQADENGVIRETAWIGRRMRIGAMAVLLAAACSAVLAGQESSRAEPADPVTVDEASPDQSGESTLVLTASEDVDWLNRSSMSDCSEHTIEAGTEPIPCRRPHEQGQPLEQDCGVMNREILLQFDLGPLASLPPGAVITEARLTMVTSNQHDHPRSPEIQIGVDAFQAWECADPPEGPFFLGVGGDWRDIARFWWDQDLAVHWYIRDVVEGWLAAGSANGYLILQSLAGSPNPYDAWFYSTEASVPTIRKPQLTVYYSVPAGSLDLWFSGGCNRSYEIGETTSLLARSTQAGLLTVRRYPGGSLVGQYNVPANQDVILGTGPFVGSAGDRRYVGTLEVGGSATSQAECRVTVVEPSVPPQVAIDIDGGCGQSYQQGSGVTPELHVTTNRSGVFEIYRNPGALYLGEFAIEDGERWSIDLNGLTDLEPGNYGIEVRLEVGGSVVATDRCSFAVRAPELTVGFEEGCGSSHVIGTQRDVTLRSSIDGRVRVYDDGQEIVDAPITANRDLRQSIEIRGPRGRHELEVELEAESGGTLLATAECSYRAIEPTLTPTSSPTPTQTSTPTRTATATPTATPTATDEPSTTPTPEEPLLESVSGTIRFSNRVDGGFEGAIVCACSAMAGSDCQLGSSTETCVVTDSSGRFELEDVRPGPISIRHPSCLRAEGRIDAGEGQRIQLGQVQIVPGDVDQDGRIGNSDAEAILDRWDRSRGELGFESALDISGDGRIGLGDLVAVKKFWLLEAPTPID